MSFFGKSEGQEDFIEDIEEEFTIRASYILLLGFSAIIATLGLITNSASVIIGSMLISPLFWPVLGISLSIVFSDRRLIRKAVYSFGVSIASVLVVSFLLTKLVPISEPSAEIMVRTNPTLMDLFIALAVSVIGVLAIRYKGISQTATGVAISIALLPVLCVVGIGAGLGSWSILKGSLLLFLANAGAIVFVGATLMYFMGIRPKNVEEKEGFKKKYITSFILLILLAIPLTYHLRMSIEQERLKKQITNVLEQKIGVIAEGSSVRDVNILFPPSFSKEKIKVSAIVFLPQNTSLVDSDEQTLISALAEITNDPIDLELSMFNMLSVKQEGDVQQEKQKQEIEQMVREQIYAINPDIDIEFVLVSLPENPNEPIEISVQIQQTDDVVPITFNQKQDINDYIDDMLQVNTNITIEFIPATILKEDDEDAKMQQKVENVIKQDISMLSPEASLIEVNISTVDKSDEKNEIQEEENVDLKITAILFVPVEVRVTKDFKEELIKHIEEDLDKKIELQLQIINFANI